ncbi:TonB-dependent receptor [Mucilaginibacter pallidiroseus]|uniref:TonB-dependent receptor n=1 Tax=Mucilaginibacter pallidiroseus TaxID=2599295 RepID=A0A563UC29_9SPHI|nr:TonB-dependent receptor [Mucilaginibacter pallidiroseus]TWR28932.1 TonB-dependent receptor [Mucilaginibacter pallidiroseus]
MIKCVYSVTIYLLIISTTLLAQKTTSSLQGRVLTIDGKGAAGVTVSIPGTNYGASTDANGRYIINIKPGSYTLQFKAMGMTTNQQQVTIAAGKVTQLADVTLEVSSIQLKDVVVTGQYAPQSLKNSVYLVRTITAEQIKMRNPAKVQDVLTDQLGFRFSNDLTLGTTDITLMGISGQRVKILLDGVPLLDRGDTRESLNQVDVNSIDHIEIVEGPMSVSYGTDALGGVINLITKKGSGGESLRLVARVQEETAGKEYQPFNGSGTHLENVGINWEHKGWQSAGNFTRNFFDGARLGWMPKEQYLGDAVLGYLTNSLHVWYRVDGTDETLYKEGTPTAENTRTDVRYLTTRWMHQLQAEWQVNDRLSINGAASYTDYSRRTQTTNTNLATGDVRLTLGTGEQDKAIFDTKFFRSTAQYKLSEKVSLQPGIEVSLTGSSGARISGKPTINDYAFFLSSEIVLGPVSLRPGARFNKNSVYDAPPIIPSLNTKVKLSDDVDLRLSYARGFRSPALRELYFNFFDASHSIRGNENLKAEYSNSFNGSLAWRVMNSGPLTIRSSIGGFYNQFKNLITTGYDAADPSVMTYINVDKSKTTGGTFENTLNYKNLTAKLGFSYTGIYNRMQQEDSTLPGFTWYPEVNSNIMYHFTGIKTDVSLFYKYNGKLPVYELSAVNGVTTIRRAERAAFSTADLTINKVINKSFTVAGGVRNLFNVTTVNNTSTDVGGAHSTGGPVPLGYGRSYFLGITYQFSKY